MPGWEGSRRKETLPKDWPARRRAVIVRDKGLCQWLDEDGKAVNDHGERICGARGTDVDHKGDRLDHRVSELRLLCSTHHDRRSAQQGGQSYIPLRRPPERHPALG
jgi:5-methylcytosine-specific restriction protein A